MCFSLMSCNGYMEPIWQDVAIVTTLDVLEMELGLPGVGETGKALPSGLPVDSPDHLTGHCLRQDTRLDGPLVCIHMTVRFPEVSLTVNFRILFELLHSVKKATSRLFTGIDGMIDFHALC